ncbi:uncharacterized protein N7484_008591 [Penicillium longicatenatum]|uniref:uncharacterized protein n=1 Tax=Penicillium longicatenatum TaxID=1561947 RepID=UPI002549732E|nr:uncharacterized protein N7484_008591 [Penicillium longicatenatum]KAJ5635278.1 hypothetical protein N7484_008591 [Penicillium longicatenatum]
MDSILKAKPIERATISSIKRTDTDACREPETFANCLTPFPYIRDVASYQPLAIIWAADHGNENTARKSLQAGSEFGYYSSNAVVFGGGNGNDAVFKYVSLILTLLT